MKIETQTSPERIHLGELIEDMSIAMLTNVDEEENLVSQPMAPLKMDTQGAIWFFTSVQSEKTDHLNVLNLSFSDESDGIYVSLSGHGELVKDRPLIEELWTPFAKPWFPEGPQSANLALLKFVPHSAEYWDTPHSKMVRLFAMAASIIAANPVGLGEHAKLNNL